MISCQASIFVLPVTYSPCNDNTLIGISKDLTQCQKYNYLWCAT